MNKLYDFINDKIEKYEIQYRMHATQRMFQRGIFEETVEKIIWEGKIIEQYEDDFPLPSFLINGTNPKGSPIHVVLAVNNVEKIIVIITTYKPDPLKWSDNFTRRVK